MPDRQHLLQKARDSRDLARRARHMSRFLSQSSDVGRIAAYADELDELAEEMEQLADDDKKRGQDKGRPH